MPLTIGGRALAEIEREMGRITTRVFGAEKPEYDPWFYRYGKLTDPQRRSMRVRYLFQLLDFASVEVAEAEVLDAGCGFGWTSVMLGLLGA